MGSKRYCKTHRKVHNKTEKQTKTSNHTKKLNKREKHVEHITIIIMKQYITNEMEVQLNLWSEKPHQISRKQTVIVQCDVFNSSGKYKHIHLCTTPPLHSVYLNHKIRTKFREGKKRGHNLSPPPADLIWSLSPPKSPNFQSPFICKIYWQVQFPHPVSD